ncbi:permease [Robinsoniella peoriensis]|uniref:permease n=1 Tax=Robinsoniella peoriensis TaxID=180332 RepID=UPI0037526E8C
MTTPLYVVAGFLDSGKTTFISRMLRHCRRKEILVLQFEEGEQILYATQHCKLLGWTKKELEQSFERIADEICQIMQHQKFDEIWVEWNGMEAFSKLERIFLQLRMGELFHIAKVIYLADVPVADMLLGQTGEAPISQVAASDLTFLRNAETKEDRSRFEQKIHGISRSEVHLLSQPEMKQTVQKKRMAPYVPAAASIGVIGSLILAAPFLEQKGLPLNTILTLFMGVFLQGVPFLLLGVLLSSAIQVFLPQSWMERVFPKNPILGMFIGMAGGFFLPVCDCASIPVFKSLLKKGVPIQAAICFMAAAPVVNPVVLLSTYYAFNLDIRIVIYRMGLGLLCAFLIGLTFFLKRPQQILKEGVEDFGCCSCGCYEEIGEQKGISGKVQLFFRHSQMEFFNVGKYLIIGIFISSVFQVADLSWLKGLGTISLPIALLAMIALSFLLSLCSSSDAVVARSMSGTFSFVPMMGFLVFVPMKYIKKLLMLNGYFKKSFVVRLALTTLVVCFGIVLIFGLLGGGGVVL